MKSLNCSKAQELINSGEIQLVDVREADEFALCKIEGATLLPLSTFPNCLDKLSKKVPVLFYCHHGRRSMMACIQADNEGFVETYNLEEGIDAWSLQIDASVARY